MQYIPILAIISPISLWHSNLIRSYAHHSGLVSYIRIWAYFSIRLIGTVWRRDMCLGFLVYRKHINILYRGRSTEDPLNVDAKYICTLFSNLGFKYAANIYLNRNLDIIFLDFEI